MSDTLSARVSSAMDEDECLMCNPPDKMAETLSNHGTEDGRGNYREALLNVPGFPGVNGGSSEVRSNDKLPENRWYLDQEDQMDHTNGEKGLIPVIHISDKELVEWYEEWDLTLIVNVLGKKINFRVLENKINREWARKGAHHRHAKGGRGL